jgi:hypothetical protein
MTLSPNYPGYYLGHVGYAYRLSGIVLAAAEELCVPLPLASLPRDRFLTLMAHGGDELLDGVLPNACREELVADDAVDHGVYFAVCQPIDGEGGHVRSECVGVQIAKQAEAQRVHSALVLGARSRPLAMRESDG